MQGKQTCKRASKTGGKISLGKEAKQDKEKDARLHTRNWCSNMQTTANYLKDDDGEKEDAEKGDEVMIVMNVCVGVWLDKRATKLIQP